MTSPTPRRTWFTTLAGVAAIACGGIGSLFSAFALLMAIGKPYANSAADPLGIFLLFILPPATLLAGIGLLRRRRWARGWMILLMAGLVGLGVKGLLAPDHAKPAYAPLPGPAADAAGRSVRILSIALIAVGGPLLLGFLSRPVRREFQAPQGTASLPVTPSPTNPASPREESGDWRVGHCGRDQMYYEELRDGTWERIEIDGEMLTGRAHHVIYFAGPDAWQAYPEWARERREEIIARIKSRFQEPDYEYQGGGGVPRSTAPPARTSGAPLSHRDGSILPMVFFLLVIAAACFWFAVEGVRDGETRLPVKHGAGRTVSREEKPLLFWTCVSIQFATGTGCTAFAGLLVMVRLRRR
jgi:hypothetical protein